MQQCDYMIEVQDLVVCVWNCRRYGGCYCQQGYIGWIINCERRISVSFKGFKCVVFGC